MLSKFRLEKSRRDLSNFCSLKLINARVAEQLFEIADMAELVDALDLKSSEVYPSCEFDSHCRHFSGLTCLSADRKSSSLYRECGFDSHPAHVLFYFELD